MVNLCSMSHSLDREHWYDHGHVTNTSVCHTFRVFMLHFLFSLYQWMDENCRVEDAPHVHSHFKLAKILWQNNNVHQSKEREVKHEDQPAKLPHGTAPEPN